MIKIDAFKSNCFTSKNPDMNELLKLRLFGLLADISQEVSSEEMKDAYECFMQKIKEFDCSERNYSEFYRILNVIRIELVFTESLYWCGQGEKCA